MTSSSNYSRRRFIHRSVQGGIGLGYMPLMGFSLPRRKENKRLPVYNEVDICVLGGSCTGVFAAVRAARLGAKVAIRRQA